MSEDTAEAGYKNSAPRSTAIPWGAGSSASGEPDDLIDSPRPGPASTVAAVQWATPAQRRFALIISAVMTVSTLLLMPMAQIRWPNIPALLQVYQTAVIGICLLTSYLMYGHYKATRLTVLLHLSAGYLYTAGILIMQFLSFPGMFTESGRVFGGSQTTIWLWFLWHAGPAVSIFHFALREYRYPGQVTKNHGRELVRTGAALGIALAATAIAVTVFHDKLPILDVNGDYSRITATGIAPGTELMLAASLALLWRVGRFRNVLHAWLGIVLVALLCDNAITMMAGSRMTLGWYVGRLGGLIAFSVFMLAYLRQIGTSYRRSIAVADQLAYSNSQLDLDIEQRKNHVEKLVEAHHRKDEFLVMLAHELRNPLAPISTAAHLLSAGQLDEKVIKKTSQMLARQVKQMTSLVDDLLDVSRVTRGLAVLHPAPLDARLVLSDAVEQAAPLIEAKRHQLEVDLHPEPVFVLADHERMVQVMTNLLNNSAKYTKPGGRIRLRMDVQDTEVVFAVTDNGIGMSPELVSRAFKLFSQGELTSERSHGGLGIGLALVKSLVELHGGHVYANSKGAEMGSEFCVTLPRIAAPQDSKPPAEAKTSQSQLRTQRMMVVDDNIDAANTLALLLRAEGHEVAVEHVARRALVRARMDPPDVCLLDIGMPDMDGNELAQRLRKQPETAKCILIALSGYTQGPAIEQAMQAGFDHYLIKPVELSKLASLLAAAATA